MRLSRLWVLCPLVASLRRLCSGVSLCLAMSGSPLRSAQECQLFGCSALDRSIHPTPKKSAACKVKGLVEKRNVFLGVQQKTSGRLRQEDLRYNVKTGRVASKVRSKNGRDNYVGSKLHAWNVAVQYAGHRLGCTHFVNMGKGDEGARLHHEAKTIYEELLEKP